MKDIQQFLDQIKTWGKKESSIIAILLVGSFARGNQKEESDVDIMIVCDNPLVVLNNTSWIEKFDEIKKVENEQWGQVTTKKVFFKNGLEVEFNFSTPAWANTNPIDPGTRRVVSSGYKILVDKTDLLNNLVNHLYDSDKTT